MHSFAMTLLTNKSKSKQKPGVNYSTSYQKCNPVEIVIICCKFMYANFNTAIYNITLDNVIELDTI
jgi:hypothetical protein